ncbi:MAG: hypothetical protein K6D94_03915 [Clostridiales bacterium]|nr:hypothetical protein [Clostridiales bacterium]
MTVDVYMRYFRAECVYDGVRRRAAKVALTSESENGKIRYFASVTFFPHTDDEDFAVSCDAEASETLYEAAGRRSKKREEKLLGLLEPAVCRLAESLGGQVFWDEPIGEERRG